MDTELRDDPELDNFQMIIVKDPGQQYLTQNKKVQAAEYERIRCKPPSPVETSSDATKSSRF